VTDARCWQCGEPFPLGEPCPGCGELVTALAIDKSHDGSCQHRLLPVTFEALADGRYRAVGFDGAELHRCLTEAQLAEVAAFTEVLSSQLVRGHADIGGDAAVTRSGQAGSVTGEPSEGVQRTTEDGDEAWIRLSDEPDIRSVEVIKYDEVGGWQVGVAVMEFVREGDAPYEDLRRGIEEAIRGVVGVSEVLREDNEVWCVVGEASGQQLAIAVASVLDQQADRLREHYDNLG
jgi:hypothetical protein